jgi:prepilin-type N-terminal cleavage/methylation domain-containing protein
MVPKIYNIATVMRKIRGSAGPHERFSQLGNSFIARSPASKRDRNERGFTLTELMIVVSIIAIVATIAFVGLRNDQFEGAYLRFTDDLVGTMIKARNQAIDDQTLVRVEVSEDRVEVYWIDPEAPPPDPMVPGSGVLLWGNYRDRMDGGLIVAEACITGMEPGITPPSEPNDAQMPTDCGTNLPKSILFQPDGSFALQDEPQPDAGMTMVIKDASSSQIYYSIIEMFPGGLIRKFDEIPEL